jgi:peptidoglycan-associated lipoprotein
MKYVRLFFFVPVLLLAFAACKQPPPPPSTSMTAPGAGSSSRTGSGDFVTTDDGAFSNSALGEGLEMRSRGFDDGIRQEGLLPSVYFDFDSSFVRAADRPLLQEAVDFLIDNPSSLLLIEGHCDWRGTTEYNLTLGDRRASSVKEYIIALGIAPERVETVSFGDREATPEGTESQMQEDRRADLIVIE